LAEVKESLFGSANGLIKEAELDLKEARMVGPKGL